MNSRELLVLAYERGYRVTDDGRLIGVTGKQLKPLIAKCRRYPTFTLSYNGKTNHIRIHRFAAYCFFGDEMFTPQVLVRHLNDDPFDFRRENIQLGTQSDNMSDMSAEMKETVSQQRRDWCLRTGKRPPVIRKWSEEIEQEVIERLKSGETTRAVGDSLGIPHNTIWYMKKRGGLHCEQRKR